MTGDCQIARAQTVHARKGAIAHRLNYGLDMIWLDPERAAPYFWGGLFRFDDAAHGGEIKGANWARQIFNSAGLDGDFSLRLLTQPRIMGTLFNPVSFWFAYQGDAIVAMLAEVNNTFGERHSYLCHHPDFAPITPRDQITARKIFYVSPFQEIGGHYRFAVQMHPDRFAIRIDFTNGAEGVLATVQGRFRPLSRGAALAAIIRRPFAGWRILLLIHWHALRLKFKGARYAHRPSAPENEVSS